MICILYTRRQVSLLVKCAALFDAELARKLRLSSHQLRLMTGGRMRPTPATLSFFNLEQQGDSYLWKAK